MATVAAVRTALGDMSDACNMDLKFDVHDSRALIAALSAHGLHIVTEAEKRVLYLAPDVASNFGRARSAELEIAFMRAVNDMLKARTP